ncbi:hypothetical protein EJ08DRAFT_212439 [Tothia fuscella]|uniref:Uncharacterized protein n=1 Tax=Tothia fuscella TaxID=1048955 RepID=A0A9P4NSE6_9PEZI|nr:hypothetical protein EJ08DRAFT_212439 [Tothia fuscella]
MEESSKRANDLSSPLEVQEPKCSTIPGTEDSQASQSSDFSDFLSKNTTTPAQSTTTAQSTISPPADGATTSKSIMGNKDGHVISNIDKQYENSSPKPRSQRSTEEEYLKMESMQYRKSTNDHDPHDARTHSKDHRKYRTKCIHAWERVKRPGPRDMRDAWEVESIWAT